MPRQQARALNACLQHDRPAKSLVALVHRELARRHRLAVRPQAGGKRGPLRPPGR